MKEYLKVICENQIISDVECSGEIFGLSFVVILPESQERLGRRTKTGHIKQREFTIASDQTFPASTDVLVWKKK